MPRFGRKKSMGKVISRAFRDQLQPVEKNPKIVVGTRKQGESRKRDITIMRIEEQSFAQLTHDLSCKISEPDKM